MSSDISQLILFVSSTSNNSRICAGMFRNAGINPKVVRLDTKAAREKVAKSKKFRVYAVPLLLMIHEDLNVSVLSGLRQIKNFIFNSIPDNYLQKKPTQKKVSFSKNSPIINKKKEEITPEPEEEVITPEEEYEEELKKVDEPEMEEEIEVFDKKSTLKPNVKKQSVMELAKRMEMERGELTFD